MKRSTWTFIAATFLCALSLSACSGKQALTAGDASPSTKPDEPVTLKVVWGANEAQAKETTEDPLMKKKFPNITFEYYNVTQLATLVTTGVAPDMINVGLDYIPILKSFGLTGDMTPLIKNNGFDMSRFDPNAINAIKAQSDKGELFAIGGLQSASKYIGWALVYNKDIFDRFGVPYPKDGMTWEEVIDLSKRFVRTEGGVEYKGLSIQDPAVNMYRQRGLRVEGTDGKVDLSHKGWSEIYSLLQSAYTAQNQWQDISHILTGQFFKSKNVAMYAGSADPLMQDAPMYENELNWDIVSYPDVKGQPNTYPGGSLNIWSIPVNSKAKKDALRVIDFMYSEEWSKRKPDKWENEVFQKKNTAAVINKKPAQLVISKNESSNRAEMRNSLSEMLKKNSDVNSTTRSLQENLQKAIDSQNTK